MRVPGIVSGAVRHVLSKAVADGSSQEAAKLDPAANGVAVNWGNQADVQGNTHALLLLNASGKRKLAAQFGTQIAQGKAYPANSHGAETLHGAPDVSRRRCPRSGWPPRSDVPARRSS